MTVKALKQIGCTSEEIRIIGVARRIIKEIRWAKQQNLTLAEFRNKEIKTMNAVDYADM